MGGRPLGQSACMHVLIPPSEQASKTIKGAQPLPTLCKQSFRLRLRACTQRGGRSSPANSALTGRMHQHHPLVNLSCLSTSAPNSACLQRHGIVTSHVTCRLGAGSTSNSQTQADQHRGAPSGDVMKSNFDSTNRIQQVKGFRQVDVINCQLDHQSHERDEAGTKYQGLRPREVAVAASAAAQNAGRSRSLLL